MSDLSLVVLLLLAIAFFLRIDFVYYIIYVTVGVYLWSQWYVPRAMRQLHLRRSFVDHAFLGERIDVTLETTNTSRMPIPWIQIRESVPPALRIGSLPRFALSFRGKQSRRIVYQIRAMRRGYYQLGPLGMTAGDLFGFKESSSILTTDHFTVYPQVIPLSSLGFPSRLPFGTLSSRQRLFEDPARPIGVRDYRSGDSQRHINWKVSAHSDSLLVKTFQPAISLEASILLNLNSVEYSRRFRLDGPEWAITVAASLANHLVNQRQAIGLATNGSDPLLQLQHGEDQDRLFDEESGRLSLSSQNSSDKSIRSDGSVADHIAAPIPPRPGREHLMRVMESLARIEAEHTISFNSWAPTACLHLSWGVTILAITPNVDEQGFQVLHRFAKSGYNPILIVVEPYVDFRGIKERARRLGFSAFHVAQRKDLYIWKGERPV